MYWQTTYQIKTVQLKIFFLFQATWQNKVKNVADYIVLEIHMVRFSIKPNNQTDEVESLNLVNKIGIANR